MEMGVREVEAQTVRQRTSAAKRQVAGLVVAYWEDESDTEDGGTEKGWPLKMAHDLRVLSESSM
jgi:hypothetical protein